MRKSSRIQRKEFSQAVDECFSHKMGGTLAEFLYSDPASKNDRDCGTTLWNEFTQAAGEDYYIAHDEPKLIAASAQQIAEITGSHRTLIDFAPGTAASTKTVPFIEAYNPALYVPIDVASDFTKNAGSVAQDYKPDIIVEPMIRDFISTRSRTVPRENAVGIFFGSTIANMPNKMFGGMPKQALIRTLRNIRSYLPVGGYLVITHDANQDETSILRSYSHELNERFALNVLRRIKRDLDTKNFDPRAFKYFRNWDREKGLLAHFALSTKHQSFEIEGNTYKVHPGESFNIINSYKFRASFVLDQAEQAGLESVETFWDEKQRIALHVLRVMPLVEFSEIDPGTARQTLARPVCACA